MFYLTEVYVQSMVSTLQRNVLDKLSTNTAELHCTHATGFR